MRQHRGENRTLLPSIHPKWWDTLTATSAVPFGLICPLFRRTNTLPGRVSSPPRLSFSTEFTRCPKKMEETQVRTETTTRFERDGVDFPLSGRLLIGLPPPRASTLAPASLARTPKGLLEFCRNRTDLQVEVYSRAEGTGDDPARAYASLPFQGSAVANYRLTLPRTRLPRRSYVVFLVGQPLRGRPGSTSSPVRACLSYSGRRGNRTPNASRRSRFQGGVLIRSDVFRGGRRERIGLPHDSRRTYLWPAVIDRPNVSAKRKEGGTISQGLVGLASFRNWCRRQPSACPSVARDATSAYADISPGLTPRSRRVDCDQLVRWFMSDLRS